MFPGVAKYRLILLALLLPLFSGAVTKSMAADDVVPIRLVALIDRDDQGESIDFPYALYYDYWASETYLISSTGRITIYDQKFFPVASFGSGRGLTDAKGVAVDRRGNIYVCQDVGTKGALPRLSIYNQAFFLVKEIIFAQIPELAKFVATRAAVAENGNIYLAGHVDTETLAGVAVFSPEGRFLKILQPPEKNAWRPTKKEAVPTEQAADSDESAPGEAGAAADAGESMQVPDGLKPKGKSAERDEDEERGQMGPGYISDVKIDRQGRIYLLSRELSLIYVLNAQEKYLFKFGEKGGVSGKLSNPCALGIDLERRVIYVCDYMRHTILCYDYDTGRFIFEFGGRGLGPLWFNFPNSIEVDQRGRVVVSDLFNRRLQVIDPNISERRPLAGMLTGLSPAEPAKTEDTPAPQPVPPEIEAPGAAGLLEPVPLAVAPGVVNASSLPAPLPPAPQTLPAGLGLLRPGSVVVSSLPAPAPPPQYAMLATPAAAVAPAAVSAPMLPPMMTGLDGGPVRLPGAMVSSPPVRSPSQPRELAPRRLKKEAVHPAPPKKLAQVVQVPPPVEAPPPAPVRVPERVAPRQPVAGEPHGLLARFRSLPAAVGVYGPVAALMGVGSWLLYTNR